MPTKRLLLTLLLAFVLTFGLGQKAEATTQYINAVVPISITIASGATTGTQTIAAATGTYFMLWGGMETTATTSAAQSFCYLTWSGTTVTATRQTSSTNTSTCKGTMVDATANLVTSVQHGTTAIASGTTNTSPITSVTTADSSINLLGWSKSNATFTFAANHPIVTLTSATVVTAKVNSLTTGMTAAWEVVNWNHTALNQSPQKFDKVWTNTLATTTQAITSVNVNNAILLYDGDFNQNCCNFAVDQQWGEITGPTVVTLNTFADGDAVEYAGTVVEFVSGVFTQNVQRGSTTIAAAATSGTTAITSSATATSAFNFTGYTTTTSVLTSHATILTACNQSSATVVTCNSGAAVPSAKTNTAAWEVMNFSASGATPAVQCSPTGNHEVGMILPYYITPPDAAFSAIITDHASFPNVPLEIILNPNDGPGAALDPVYTTVISQLQAAGIVVLGYIETGYGIANHDFTPQNETTIKAQIAQWYAWYPTISGIFLDEMDSTASTTGCTSTTSHNCITYYQNLTAYVKTFGASQITYGNPGNAQDPAYFSASPITQDRLMVWETTAYPANASDATNAGLCAKYNCADITYAVSYSAPGFALMYDNVNWVYVTDVSAANPYNAPASYLITALTALQAYNTGGGSSCPSALAPF